MLLEQELFARFAERGLKIHSRGSFGCYHPNSNIIPSAEDKRPRNIRINPGLNEEENQILIDFLKDIPAILADPPKKKRLPNQ